MCFLLNVQLRCVSVADVKLAKIVWLEAASRAEVIVLGDSTPAQITEAILVSLA